MISYVWNIDFPLKPGTGGTENFILGHVRELLRRGIETEIVTIWQGQNDGREYFPDIPFRAISPDVIAAIDNTVIFASIPVPMATKHKSYVNIPYPAPATPANRLLCCEGIDDKILLVPSKASAIDWAAFLQKPQRNFKIIYPFAMPEFALAQRPKQPKTTNIKVLYASRLVPEKGIYTLLHTIHLLGKSNLSFIFTVTGGDALNPDSQRIRALLMAHPAITVVAARQTSKEMAELMAQHDIVVVPTCRSWHEPFGMVSVEGQHSGCRVVATNVAGLPETDCGGLVLVEPDNPKALAQGLLKAAQLGPLTSKERRAATQKFTVHESVDSLLRLINATD